MKFSLISDMHVNHPQLKTPYDKLEEIIVVAGDTSDGLESLKFLNKLRNKGHRVWACDGNHEHYSNVSRGREYSETLERFREEFPAWGMIQKPDIPIVLVNGWYEVRPEMEHIWYEYMNDGRYSGLYGDQVTEIAKVQAQQVKAALRRWKNNGDKGVVVTHTAPCQETLDPKYEGHLSNNWYWSPYMRELLAYFNDQILVWCHGHTHTKNEAVVDGVRVVCNPRGYPGENPDWEPLTVEV